MQLAFSDSLAKGYNKKVNNRELQTLRNHSDRFVAQLLVGYRMNFRRIARARRAACTGPKIVSIKTSNLARLFAGAGSGF